MVDFFAERSNQAPPAKEGGAVDFFSERQNDAAPQALSKEVVLPRKKTAAEKLDMQEVMTSIGFDLNEIRHKAGGRQIRMLGGAAQTFQGIKQLGLLALEELGLIDEGSTEAYTAKTTEDKKLFEGQLKKDFGEADIMDEIASIGGRALPFLVIPGGGAGPTLLGTATKATASGAAVGATDLAEGTKEQVIDQKADSAAMGAALGFGANLINGLPIIRNAIKNNLLKGRGTEFTEQGIKISEKVPLKLSQITGNAATESLENLVRATDAGEELARNIETKQIVASYKQWKRISATLFPREKVADRVGNPDVLFGGQVRLAFNKIMGDANKGTGLIGQRAKNAAENFSIIDDVAGNKPVIPVNEFLSKLDSLIIENSQRGATSSKRILAKELQSLKDDFSDNLVTGREIQGLLHSYGRASSGSDRLFADLDKAVERRPAKELFKALKKDLDAAADGGSGEFAQSVKRARDQYAADTAAVESVRGTTIGALFGKNGTMPVADIERAFLKMKPDQIKESMDVLSSASPSLQARLQRLWVEKWLEKSTKAADKDVFPFIAGRMTELKTDPAFKAVFNTAESRKIVNEGIEAVRRVVMFNHRTGGRSVSRLKDFARVIDNRDKTFIARLSSDLFTPKAISHSMLDKDGIKALSEMAKTFNQNRAAAILVGINNAIQDEDQEE